MLAGAEKTLYNQRKREVKEPMSAIEHLLAGLIDYAGLYPPASLDMPTAWRNYLSYAQGKHAPALGRFVVDMTRLDELRETAGDFLRSLRLSVIAGPAAEWDGLQFLLRDGFPIDMVEMKTDEPAEIERIAKCIPAGIKAYFEVPVEGHATEALAAISACGARAKLRMGGVVAEAFPSVGAIAEMLKTLAASRVSFKATAGLHHAIRSRHAFTYKSDSPSGTMHGFLNLACAAALVYFGGETDEARRLLEEEDPAVWQVTSDAVRWRGFRWSADQLGTARKNFLVSFGSCSFAEPIHDLEALGWL